MLPIDKATIEVRFLLWNLQKEVVNDFLKSIIISATYGRKDIEILERSPSSTLLFVLENFEIFTTKFLQYLHFSSLFGQIMSKKNQKCLFEIEFDISINILKLMVVLKLSLLERKHSFWKFCSKKKKAKMGFWCTLVPELIKGTDLSGNVDLFYFEQQISVLGKFDPQNQNSLFKINIVTYTNLNLVNPSARFVCPALNLQYPFWYIYANVKDLPDHSHRKIKWVSNHCSITCFTSILNLGKRERGNYCWYSFVYDCLKTWTFSGCNFGELLRLLL